MKNIPIVYLYEEQLKTVISINSNEIIRGIAFEWKDENVFHAYIKYPQVAPAGIPTIVFYQLLEREPDLDFIKVNFSKVLSQEKLSRNPVIGVFLYIGGDKLHQKCLMFKDEAISICDLRYIPGKSELYSRSKGLLESDIIEKKSVLIIGLGSFGSHIAVELAKAGVGSFFLIDFDRVELSNIARHVCGVNDLGRYKTLAIRDAILMKNPFAHVETFEVDINEHLPLLETLFKKADLIICATDNNHSRFNINELGIENKKVVLFGRAITRAEGGDVFKLQFDGPCYNCLIGNVPIAEEEISNIKQAKEALPAYMQETDDQLNETIQVGLSSDILPLCNMMVKLGLIELSKDSNSGLASLANELTYNYYIWSNRRDKEYLKWAPFNKSEGHPTILKWYGVGINKDPNCLSCSLTTGYE